MYAMVESKLSPEKPVVEDRSLRCGICHKYFNFQSDLKRHSQVHSGFKPHCCTYCSKRFLKSSDLKRHVRTHTGEKPYPCLICSRPFANSYDLTKHTRVHTGEKPYSCPECGRRFANTSNLRIHQRAHTGEKPYKCVECNKKFSYASGLRDHKKTHLVTDPVEKLTDRTPLQVKDDSAEHLQKQTLRTCEASKKVGRNSSGLYRSESHPEQKTSEKAVASIRLPPRRHSEPPDSRVQYLTGGNYIVSNIDRPPFDNSGQHHSIANRGYSVPDFATGSTATEQKQHLSCYGDTQSQSSCGKTLQILLKGECLPDSLHTATPVDPYKETRAQLNAGVRFDETHSSTDRTLNYAKVREGGGHHSNSTIMLNSSERNNGIVDEREEYRGRPLRNSPSLSPLPHTSIDTRIAPNQDNNIDCRPHQAKRSSLTQYGGNDRLKYPLKKRPTSFQSDSNESNREHESLITRHIDTESHSDTANQVEPMKMSPASYRTTTTSQHAMGISPFELSNAPACYSQDLKHQSCINIANSNDDQRDVHIVEYTRPLLRLTEPQYQYNGSVSPSNFTNQSDQVGSFPRTSETSSSSHTAKNAIIKSAIDDAHYIVPVSNKELKITEVSRESSVQFSHRNENEVIDSGTAPYTPVPLSCLNVFHPQYAQGPPPLVAFTQHTANQSDHSKYSGYERPNVKMGSLIPLWTSPSINEHWPIMIKGGSPTTTLRHMSTLVKCNVTITNHGSLIWNRSTKTISLEESMLYIQQNIFHLLENARA
ncbi:unnamed protein product [Owenia fusiformis]|uniref:Uncharacterized protein n=1 Tax=Owenia fusiformis TaxID=6347 RepID=A0A8J1UQJ0_OWEFU|nr:unnamed protein product [Owenia fusiformis]